MKAAVARYLKPQLLWVVVFVQLVLAPADAPPFGENCIMGFATTHSGVLYRHLASVRRAGQHARRGDFHVMPPVCRSF